jgi:hypothetical protein
MPGHGRGRRGHPRSRHPRLLAGHASRPRGPHPERSEGGDTNAVRAVPLGIIKGVDHQFTGKVERIDKDFLTSLINEPGRPARLPLAFGPTAGPCASTPTCSPPSSPRRSTPPRSSISPRTRASRSTASSSGRSPPPPCALLRTSPRPSRSADAQQGRPRRQGRRDRHAARAPRGRPDLRRPAQRDLLQRGRRHADLRQRIPADPQGHPRDVRFIHSLTRPP